MSNFRCTTKAALLLGLHAKIAAGNVVGGDFQSFNPNYSSQDFLSVEPASTMVPGQISFGTYLDLGTNVLPTIEARDTEPSRSSVDDTLLSSHLNIGYGVLRNLEVGAAFPMIANTSSSSDNYRGEITANGMSYARLGAKYKVYSFDSYSIAAILDLGKGMMKDNPYQGSTGTTSATGMIAGSATFPTYSLGLNLGYKMRSSSSAVIDEESQDSPIEPIGSQLLWSAAGRFDVKGKSHAVIAEIVGATAMGEIVDRSDRKPTAAEISVSYRYAMSERNLQFFGGVGTEQLHGAGSGSLRFVAGASMAIGTTPLGGTSTISQSTSDDEQPVSTTEELAKDQEETPKEKQYVDDEETTVDIESYELGDAKFPTFENNGK
jgi:hypothetical protein